MKDEGDNTSGGLVTPEAKDEEGQVLSVREEQE
jgi:hypothetical protein